MRRQPTRTTRVWGTWIGVAYVVLGSLWVADGTTLPGVGLIAVGIAFFVVHGRRLVADSRSEQSR